MQALLRALFHEDNVRSVAWQTLNNVLGVTLAAGLIPYLPTEMHVEQHHTCVAPNITAVLEDIVEKLHFAVDTTGQRLLQVTIVSSTLCFAVQKSARRDRNTLLYKQFSFVHLSVSLYFFVHVSHFC